MPHAPGPVTLARIPADAHGAHARRGADVYSRLASSFDISSLRRQKPRRHDDEDAATPQIEARRWRASAFITSFSPGLPPMPPPRRIVFMCMTRHDAARMPKCAPIASQDAIRPARQYAAASACPYIWPAHQSVRRDSMKSSLKCFQPATPTCLILPGG